jgi:hypothetical protein
MKIINTFDISLGANPYPKKDKAQAPHIKRENRFVISLKNLTISGTFSFSGSLLGPCSNSLPCASSSVKP